MLINYVNKVVKMHTLTPSNYCDKKDEMLRKSLHGPN